MRILHVVAGLPQAGGGLSELVPRFAIEAARLGHEVTIATVAGAHERLSAAAGAAAAGGVRVVRFDPSAPRALFFSWAMLQGLPELARAADLVHVHSNWTFPVWWASQCACRAGKPLVMSPQGCLDPVRLAHSAWKKRLAGVFDRRCLRRANVIHATSDAERGWIERYVGGRPCIRLIPNGVELPEPGTATAKPANRTRRVLSLGRLHPLKGLDLLLDAWTTACRSGTAAGAWRLVIAGPDEQGTRARLEAQAGSLGLTNVELPGPLYGDEKRRALADADLFVVPSRSENFGIAVAEALAAGLPVIATKATPWADIDGSCGWWVDLSAVALARALATAMQQSDEQRTAMGDRGRLLIQEKYRWPIVARAMTSLYRDLIAGLP